MTYRGHVENGVVVLDEPAKLPEGAEVEVTLREQRDASVGDEKRIPTLAERLAPLIGCVKGLPSDFAENHDHYLHGAPKKK